MKKEEVLDTAKSLVCGDRAAAYGSAKENFARIARMWEPIIGKEITPEQVAMCMVQVKITRLIQTRDHADSWVDIAGYAACGGEISSKVLFNKSHKMPEQIPNPSISHWGPQNG